MSASQIKLSVDDAGVFHSPSVNSEYAVRASEYLQENHDKNHIFYESGFHSTSRSYTASLGQMPDSCRIN